MFQLRRLYCNVGQNLDANPYKEGTPDNGLAQRHLLYLGRTQDRSGSTW
ncbi:MAG: hypothetical protein KME23_12235 [Goleter apudmare HA4340-LM2]|nr:hypothetical protein [Goleter apudmare HA4340-LM2]